MTHEPRFHEIETPPGWGLLMRGGDGYKFRRLLTPQTVIISWRVEDDGFEWTHLSTAFPHRLPKWEELKDAKDAFLGDALALQVFPPAAEYVNLNPYVLHLWSRHPDAVRPTPDFTAFLPDGRRTI